MVNQCLKYEAGNFKLEVLVISCNKLVELVTL